MDAKSMIRPVRVKALPNFRLWLRYQDGTEGEVDLSEFAGRGVFKNWTEPGVFEKVELGPRGELVWPGGADLCPDALYLRLTGKQPDEAFPNLRKSRVDA